MTEYDQNPYLCSMKRSRSFGKSYQNDALYGTSFIVIGFHAFYQNTDYSSPTKLCMLVNLIKS